MFESVQGEAQRAWDREQTETMLLDAGLLTTATIERATTTTADGGDEIANSTSPR